MNLTYLTLSQTFTDRFLAVYKTKATQDTQITTSGVSGRFKVNVKDILISIAKNRFMALANPNNLDEENVTKIWTVYKNNSHHRILECIMTDCIRNAGILYDCVFINTNETIINFYFRESAELITQHPQTFLPLFHDSLDYLQEVKQGEYAITITSSNKPVLATWHLAECVAFVAFNHFHKIGILAHIDPCTDVDDFFEKIKGQFKPLATDYLSIDYLLIGGVENCNHSENIKQAALKANDLFFNFKFISEIGEKIPSKVFQKDSWWGVSMRLNRSVALDLRENNPLEFLKSYEPDLNDNSSLHKRTGGAMEAQLFERKREKERVLTLSYNGL